MTGWQLPQNHEGNGPKLDKYISTTRLMSRPSTVPPLLITEALGFSPQLLLDDIINIANAAVTDGVNGLEGFLQQWVEKRSAGKEYNNQEIEQWHCKEMVNLAQPSSNTSLSGATVRVGTHSGRPDWCHDQILG